MGKKLEKNAVNVEMAPEQFVVHTEAINTLFHGKTPGYPRRFKSWAQKTQGEHLDNLVNALLSNLAYTMAIGSSTGVSDERLRGRADGILLMKEYILLHASGTQEQSVTNAEAEDLSDLI